MHPINGFRRCCWLVALATVCKQYETNQFKHWSHLSSQSYNKKGRLKKNSHGIVPQYAWGNLPSPSIQHRIRDGSMVMSQMNDVYPNTWVVSLNSLSVSCVQPIIHSHQTKSIIIQTARERTGPKACALRALGLLLADGAPTVGRGKTFWWVN